MEGMVLGLIILYIFIGAFSLGLTKGSDEEVKLDDSFLFWISGVFWPIWMGLLILGMVFALGRCIGNKWK